MEEWLQNRMWDYQRLTPMSPNNNAQIARVVPMPQHVLKSSGAWILKQEALAFYGMGGRTAWRFKPRFRSPFSGEHTTSIAVCVSAEQGQAFGMR